jgi:hypothetical protein
LNVSVGSSSSGPIHFGNQITIKLAAETHLLWRAQVYTQLRSNLLHGYVEGTFPCPASTVSSTKDGATETSPNPLFAAWVQQDQAILSALLSTSTPAVGAMIMFATTSAEAWTIIERTFAAQTSARSSQIRAQLAKMEKLDTSIAVYYNKIKTLSDTLTSIGQPLRPEEFSNFVLDGLDEDYDSVVEAVRNRDDPMPAHDLYSRLLSTEQRIDNRRPSAMSPHSANAAKFNGKPYRPSSGAPTSNYRPGPPAPSSGHQPKPAPATGGGAPGGRADSRFDGRPGGSRTGAATVCQLCDTAGHVAARCFKRFQKSYLGMYNDGRFLDR